MLLNLKKKRPIFASFIALCALVALMAVPVTAGTLTGTVRNTTTNRAAGGQEVVLLALQGGMEAVATTRADAQGRFRFEHDSIGRTPMLLRVQYRGVNYHQNVPPGRDTADVEIFEPTQDPRAIQVTSRFIVLQPSGSALLVGEEFLVENRTQPPTAYYKPDGTFEFFLPEGGQLAQASAWGPSGMPLVQGTMDKGPSRYAIAFALRPGENGVRLSYQVPYADNRATLRASSPYAAARVLLVAPPSLTVEGSGFQPAGTEQGFNLYAREAVAAGMTFEFSVSGTAPPPSDAGAAAGGSDSTGAAATGAVGVLPGRLDSLRWILIIGFLVLFGLGAMYLWRKPKLAPATASSAAAQVEAEVKQQAGRSLDEIKEVLFRLELRRQAGTISEEDYTREYGRAQRRLRQFLKR